LASVRAAEDRAVAAVRSAAEGPDWDPAVDRAVAAGSLLLAAWITNISKVAKVPPRCGRQSVAGHAQLPGLCRNREDRIVRKTLIALAATTGLVGLSCVGASAASVIPASAVDHVSSVQKADWDDCGPRCQYWRHRRLGEQRHWRQQEWREHHNPYYGYNYYNGYYR
jgi:hypothetical protein